MNLADILGWLTMVGLLAGIYLFGFRHGARRERAAAILREMSRHSEAPTTKREWAPRPGSVDKGAS